MNATEYDARRLMTLCVPRAGVRSPDDPTFRPVSFGIVDEGLLNFRLVDACGRTLDLRLNDIVADALAGCIALRHGLPATVARSEPDG